MKYILCFYIMISFFISMSLVHGAEDMRETETVARNKREAVFKRATLEKQKAAEERALLRQKILTDRNALLTQINNLKKETRVLEKENQTLDTTYQRLKKKSDLIKKEALEKESEVNELIGSVRVNAKDLNAIFSSSLQNLFEGANSVSLKQINLKQIGENSGFPGMEQIRSMVRMLFEEIRLSGLVRIVKGNMVGRSGENVTADILLIGNFTAAYRLNSETGFLIQSQSGKTLFALSRLPGHRLKRSIEKYMEGKSQAVPIDISKGGALRQLTHKVGFFERISNGGPVVYPILALFLFAIIIVIERTFSLFSKKLNADEFMSAVFSNMKSGAWDKCEQICQQNSKKPVAKIILSVLEQREMSREKLENVLQEAILREIPPIERFLSTLGMLAAIAPLLGLLGTVTGMINTFHAITFFGTGDPRTMSGGISEALVTTMLGLSVAIPVMLSHTLLSRMVETQIQTMEEKAVAFVNALQNR